MDTARDTCWQAKVLQDAGGVVCHYDDLDWETKISVLEDARGSISSPRWRLTSMDELGDGIQRLRSTHWLVADVPTGTMKGLALRYMEDEWDSWESYHDWYTDGQRGHAMDPPKYRWSAEVACTSPDLPPRDPFNEFLDSGWPEFHRYVAAGDEHIAVHMPLPKPPRRIGD